MISDSIQAFYSLNFEMTFEHGMSVNDLDNMMPWEREVLMFQIMKRLQDRKAEATT